MCFRGRVRQQEVRKPEPTAGVKDSQTLKTTEMGGPRGYDAGKVRRAKYSAHVGLVLVVLVLPANIQDRDGGWKLLEIAHRVYPSVVKVWADGAYAGDLVRRAREKLGVDVEIVKKPPDTHTFRVLHRRWVVERTFGWLNRERRLSKDYERLADTTEAFVNITMVRLMARRLARHVREPVIRVMIVPAKQPLPKSLPAFRALPALPPAKHPLPMLPPAEHPRPALLPASFDRQNAAGYC